MKSSFGIGPLIGVIVGLIACSQVMANDEFNPASCASVNGTGNIHWEVIENFRDCIGIELSNVVYDPYTRIATFTGYGTVGGENCLGYGTYYLELSEDGLTLEGSPELNDIPWTLTRTSVQDCFVGRWVNNREPFDDWLGHISTDAFPPGAFSPANTSSVPALSLQGIALLIALVAGFTYYKRRKVTGV